MASWARRPKLRIGMLSSLSGNLATMGPGTPYVIAAKSRLEELEESLAP